MILPARNLILSPIFSSFYVNSLTLFAECKKRHSFIFHSGQSAHNRSIQLSMRAWHSKWRALQSLRLVVISGNITCDTFYNQRLPRESFSIDILFRFRCLSVIRRPVRTAARIQQTDSHQLDQRMLMDRTGKHRLNGHRRYRQRQLPCAARCPAAESVLFDVLRVIPRAVPALAIIMIASRTPADNAPPNMPPSAAGQRSRPTASGATIGHDARYDHFL